MPPQQFAEWAALCNKVELLDEHVADLHDRFVGWQKRSTMREARAVGAAQGDVLAQALSVLHKPPEQKAPENVSDIKASLRARAFPKGTL